MGGITAGLLADYSGKPATTCAVMLVAAIPTVRKQPLSLVLCPMSMAPPKPILSRLQLFAYEAYGHACPLEWEDKDGCYSGNVIILMLLGLLVNGPYALITTAVSADLGAHPCLQVRAFRV